MKEKEENSDRKTFRFLKVMTTFCASMLVFLTGKNAFLELRGTPPDYLLAAAEYAPFGLELWINARIKINELKHEREDYIS